METLLSKVKDDHECCHFFYPSSSICQGDHEQGHYYSPAAPTDGDGDGDDDDDDDGDGDGGYDYAPAA